MLGVKTREKESCAETCEGRRSKRGAKKTGKGALIKRGYRETMGGGTSGVPTSHAPARLIALMTPTRTRRGGGEQIRPSEQDTAGIASSRLNFSDRLMSIHELRPRYEVNSKSCETNKTFEFASQWNLRRLIANYTLIF